LKKYQTGSRLRTPRQNCPYKYINNALNSHVAGFYLVHAAGKQKTMLRVLEFEGFFTNGTDLSSAFHNVPSEVACGYICLLDEICEAFFYDNSTLLCKPEQQCRFVVV